MHINTTSAILPTRNSSGGGDNISRHSDAVVTFHGMVRTLQIHTLLPNQDVYLHVLGMNLCWNPEPIPPPPRHPLPVRSLLGLVCVWRGAGAGGILFVARVCYWIPHLPWLETSVCVCGDPLACLPVAHFLTNQSVYGVSTLHAALFGGNAVGPMALRRTQDTLEVRVGADGMVVEVFWDGGRARTTSGPVYSTGEPMVSAGLEGIAVDADVWKMGSAWLASS
jgi:hypothetical protein